MRLDDYRFSDNVGDRGRGGGGGFGGGGMGLILGLVASRFGIGGVLLLGLGYFALSFLGGQTGSAPQQGARGGAGAQQACTVDETSAFSCRVLASTEDTWGRLFQQNRSRYQPARFWFFSGSVRSACGAAQAAAGPFYCPGDQSIYLDRSFFAELRDRFNAAGDFAIAYVIAHEVGHHVQNLTGTLGEARRQQARLSPEAANRVQVKVELQADCYAGVWGGLNRERLEPGDIEEGMRAAEAIGDDTLQRRAQGYVVPESFTHGTSAERMAWLRRGLETADPAACDTFAGR